MVNIPPDTVPTINAIASLVLVIVTGAYVLLTWRMVKETRRARKQEVMPVLNIDTEPISIGAWAPKIENVGNGPALNVNAIITLEPAGERSEISSKSIAVGEFSGVMQPRVDEDTHEEYDTLTVEGSYTDVFGENHTFEREYDLELLSKLDAADSTMGRDKRTRQLKMIERQLKSIAENIEMGELNKAAKMKSFDKILTELQRQDSLTLRELVTKTGMTRYELGADLIRLSEAGAIEYSVDRDELFDEENLDVEIKILESNNES